MNCNHLGLQPQFSGQKKINRQKLFVQLRSRTKLANRECQHLLIAAWALLSIWTYTGIVEEGTAKNQPPRPIVIISTTLRRTRTFILFMYPLKTTAHWWTFEFRWWQTGASVHYYWWWVHTLGLGKSWRQRIHLLQQGKGFSTTSAKAGIFGC